MGIKRGQNNKVKGCGRLLVTVTVYGSAGPLRFLVNEGEMASVILRTALKTYAREGRLPVLGTDLDEFLLYHANGGFDALEPGYEISITGARNFLLCKKQIETIEEKVEEEKVVSRSVPAGKKGHLLSWKSVPAGKKGHLLSWKSGGLNKVNKLLSFRI